MCLFPDVFVDVHLFLWFGSSFLTPDLSEIWFFWTFWLLQLIRLKWCRYSALHSQTNLLFCSLIFANCFKIPLNGFKVSFATPLEKKTNKNRSRRLRTTGAVWARMNLAALSAAATDSPRNKSPRTTGLPNLGIHKISLSWRSVEQIQILHLVGSISLTCSAPVLHRGRWSSLFLICRQKSQRILAFKGKTEQSWAEVADALFNAAQILCSWFFGSFQLQTEPAWSSAPSWVLCSSSSSCWPSWQFSSGS